MSKTKIKVENLELKRQRIINTTGNIIRDARPKLDVSAIKHGGTITNLSSNKNKEKKKK